MMERMARKGLVPGSGLQDNVSSDILTVDERATPATPDLYYGYSYTCTLFTVEQCVERTHNQLQ